MKKLLLEVFLSLTIMTPGFAQEAHHEHSKKEGGQAISVKGEIIDMACYIDHNATGEKHASCAKTCIESGLPVGIKSEDGKVYLLVGEHKPINKSLVKFAAKTITMKGKLVGRDGFNMLENAEIVGSEMSEDKSPKTIYTCPMHPEVKQTSPGKCPKCGMNLEPIKK